MPSCTDEQNGKTNDQFSLEILPITYGWQHRHGIRHGDYLNYRHFCTRKIQKIRKALHFPLLFKNKVVNKVVSEETLKDMRYLWILLLDAERAWSYANELKQEANTEPRKRFRQRAKLKKATIYAKELNDLITRSDKCDARSKVESLAYYHWSLGNLHFERGEWDLCQNNLLIAQNLYQELCLILSPLQIVPYQQRRDEIATAIRFARYNLDRLNETDGENLAKNKDVNQIVDDNLVKNLINTISEDRKKNLVEIDNIFAKHSDRKTIQIESEKVREFLEDAIDQEKGLVDLISSFKERDGVAETGQQLSQLEMSGEKERTDASECQYGADARSKGVNDGKIFTSDCRKKWTRLDPHRVPKLYQTLSIYDNLLSGCSVALKSLQAPQNSAGLTTDQAYNDNLAELRYYLEYLRLQYLLGRRLYRYFALLLPMAEKLGSNVSNKPKEGSPKTAPPSSSSNINRLHKRWTPLLVSTCIDILECISSLKLIISDVASTPKKGLVDILETIENFFRASKYLRMAEFMMYKKTGKDCWDKSRGLLKKSAALSSKVVAILRAFPQDQQKNTLVHLGLLVTATRDNGINIPGFAEHLQFPGIISRANGIVSLANKHLDDIKIERVLSMYEGTEHVDKERESAKGKESGSAVQPKLTLLDIIHGEGKNMSFEVTAETPIVPLPPEMVPVQCCKPAFFDLAYNHLAAQQASLLEKFERLASPDASGDTGTQQSSSLGGMVKSWFWNK